MFLNIQIDLIILKRYDEQFTLTTKKIIAYHLQSCLIAATCQHYGVTDYRNTRH